MLSSFISPISLLLVLLLCFDDQYLEISTGLGENTQPHGIKLFPNDPYTLYTTDISAINLNTDLYGSHPVYMDLRNVGGEAFAHAVLLLNGNGMDVFYRGVSLISTFSPGLLLSMLLISTLSLWADLLSMPYWSFGFHQCRWGYHNLSVVEDVVANYEKAEIPLDVIWNDVDHMDGHKDFTLNPTNYPRPKLLAFLNKIHAKGVKYFVIIDPGIGVNSTYGVYQRGMANDVFIKYEVEPFLAQVWPGPVYFPDFLNPKTVSWWGNEIHRFHELVPVDGLWIDMNEASNFCTGKCTIPKGKQCPSGTGPGWICCLDCQNVTATRWDDPPYRINASGRQAPIGYKTIATSAVHYNGVREYDAHSLCGFSQAIATHKALQGLEGKRPFILSRSTFAGSGAYAAHWTGDNKGTWNDLSYSISTMLNFGIFGVPMVGSDICGFYPAPTEELCNRWIELGAFYPFSRDHANYYSPRQELYQWVSVAKSARNALELYGLSTQFLLGRSVMVSPVLTRGKTDVKALFPQGTWYRLFDMTQTIVSKEAHFLTLDAPLDVINVHLYQNTNLPMQRGGTISKEARMTPFSLIVTFPAGASEGQAKGELFLDDDQLPEMKLGNGYSTFINFYATMSQKTIKIWSEVQEGEFAVSKGWTIEKVTVLGLDGIGNSFELEVDGQPVKETTNIEFSTSEHNYLHKLEGEHRKKTMMVELKGLELPVGKDFAMSWKMGM
ncbi:Glycoside hydrolase family 31 [Dillenia turbinata]|uniref:Glycoside hydrolase family 31 n=1 Tax=Dillenia turbinata TaxID=194707 RepID=A0AAN8Z3R7_9MAGN